MTYMTLALLTSLTYPVYKCLVFLVCCLLMLLCTDAKFDIMLWI